MRNRLIAALASATCVVEAAQRSGSSRTATIAAELHRSVFAVPGPVTSQASVGTHRLIQDRIATLAGDVEDLREALQPLQVRPSHVTDQQQIPTAMQEVLDALPGGSHRGLNVQETSVKCGLDEQRTRHILRSAQRMGYARCDDEGLWVFVSRPGGAGEMQLARTVPDVSPGPG